MKTKTRFGLALVLIGGLAFLGFNYFFRSWRANREWTQAIEWRFRSGEKLREEIHLLSGFSESTVKSSTLFIEWGNGARESLSTATQYPYNHSMNHFALSTNGDYFVIGAGKTVFYREKTAPPNQWHRWRLTATPEIFRFIKEYLDAQAPDAYGFKTNQNTPPDTFIIKCNRLGVEQPLTITSQGELPYEVEAIRNEGRELVIVPFAANPFAPKLVVSPDGDFGRWKFDERLTAIENKRPN